MLQLVPCAGADLFEKDLGVQEHSCSTAIFQDAPGCHQLHCTHIQVVDEGLVGFPEERAVLCVLHHVQPVGLPELGELPTVPQRLPQGAVPRQGHPAEHGSASLHGHRARDAAVPAPLHPPQASPSADATLSCVLTSCVGDSSASPPRETPSTLRSPLPLQAAAWSEAEHGEEEEEEEEKAVHGGGAGLHGEVVLIPTGTPSPRAISDNAPLRVNTGLWLWQ